MDSMLRKYKTSAMAATLMLALPALCGCSSDSDEPVDGSRVPISLASVMEGQRMQTRFVGDGSGTQATDILAGQTVWIWANYAETANGHNIGDKYLDAWKLTAGSSGQLSGVVTTTLAGSLRYYPTQNEKITLYGVQGNFSETITEQSTTFPATLTHSVNTNQTSSVTYASSDLLWGIIKDQQYQTEANGDITAETIVIPFKHLLSKVEITLALKDGESVYTDTDLRAAKVELMHVKPEVSLTMSDGTISAAGGTETAITVKTAGSAAGYGSDWLETIVPPQTFAASKAFICVTMQVNGADRPLYYVPSADLTLEANHRYRFSFVISSQAITLGSVTYDDFNSTTDGISPVPVP